MAKAPVSKPRPAPQAQVASYAPSSDPVPLGRSRGYATWGEAFLDWEKHENLAPGQEANPTRRTTTGGVISGMDWTVRGGGSVPEGIQFGILTGYSHSSAKFTDATSNTFSVGGDVKSELTTQNVRQTVEGGSVGGFLSMFSGAFSADALFKVDILDVERRGTLVENLFSKECAVDFALIGTERVNLDGDTSVTNYTLAGNLNYRFDLSSSTWLEPTIGARYTFSDYGSDADKLGFKDGSVFRIQGGLRYGHRMLAGGNLVTTTLTGLLYSDVAIEGLQLATNNFAADTAQVDEGKLRVLGALQTRIETPTGFTYYGQVEMRGGDDLFGLGGKVGMRYEW